MKKADLSPEQYQRNLACSRAWKEKNKEKLKAKESSPEYRKKRRVYEKKWRSKPKIRKKRIAYSRRYLEENREEINAKSRTEEAREKKRIAERKRKEARKQLLATMTPDEVKDFLKKEESLRLKRKQAKKVRDAFKKVEIKIIETEKVKTEIVQLQIQTTLEKNKQKIHQEIVDRAVQRILFLRETRKQRLSSKYQPNLIPSRELKSALQDHNRIKTEYEQTVDRAIERIWEMRESRRIRIGSLLKVA